MTFGHARLAAAVRRAPALGLIVLSFTILTGCWDFRETEERTLALMVGIDAGERQEYAVSVQLVLPQNLKITGQTGGGGGGGGGKPFRVLVEEGTTIEAAVERIRQALYRDLDFGHTKVIVLGEEVARRGLDRLGWLWRNERVPGIAFLTVAHGRAAEVVAAESPAVEVPVFFLFNMLTPTSYNRTASVVPVLRWKAFSHLHARLQDVYLTGVTATKYGVNTEGVAAFHRGRMVGWLDPEQAADLNWVLGRRLTREVVAAPPPGLPGEPVSVRIVGGLSRYAVDLDDDDAPVLNVRLMLQGVMRDSGPGEIRAAVDEVQQALARASEEKVRRTIARLQAMQADLPGFGERLRREYSDHPAVRSPDAWRRAFARAPVRVEAVVRLATTGYRD